jgi:hypothetical protein
MAGHANGRDAHDDPDRDDKVASLDAARRRAALRAKEESRAARARRYVGMTVRDWIVGAVVIAMALGMVWHWFSPLVGATGATR